MIAEIENVLLRQGSAFATLPTFPVSNTVKPGTVVDIRIGTETAKATIRQIVAGRALVAPFRVSSTVRKGQSIEILIPRSATVVGEIRDVTRSSSQASASSSQTPSVTRVAQTPVSSLQAQIDSLIAVQRERSAVDTRRQEQQATEDLDVLGFTPPFTVRRRG